jgi:hypothetical protein
VIWLLRKEKKNTKKAHRYMDKAFSNNLYEVESAGFNQECIVKKKEDNIVEMLLKQLYSYDLWRLGIIVTGPFDEWKKEVSFYF